MIPQNITRDHIFEALNEIDKLAYSERREPAGFYLRFDEKKYPPKVVISISNKFANGQELSFSTFSGWEETNTFLYSRGFEIITLSGEPVFTDQKVGDEGDEQNDFATRLKEYLERKFHIKVNRDGSRAPLAPPSGSQVYVRGSRELESDYGYYSYYHLVKRNYETIVKNQNQYFAVVYKEPTLTFIFNGDELKEIFDKYEPTIPKNRPPRWHFDIQEKEGRYNLKLHNKQAKEYNIDSNLNKWDQINDFTGENEILVNSKPESRYFLVQVTRFGSENVLRNKTYQHEGWNDTPRDKDHGKVSPGDILLVYFGNTSIDFKKQIKKVYRVDSVTEDHTKFNLSEIKNLKGISLDTIRSSLQHSILRKEVFSNVAQQGFNIIRIEKSDFDQIMSLEDRPPVRDINSCLKSFPDYKDREFIRSAREILNEFLTRFPFGDKPYLIDDLKQGDIYQKENKDNFLNWIQYKTDKIAGVGVKSGNYRESALKNLTKFKQLLKIAVDPSRILSEKLDAGWNELSGFGGDNILAKKIIYLFNSDRALAIITEDMEEFLTSFGKDYLDESTKVYGKNYQQLTKGQRYELLYNILMKIKNEVNNSWDNITFNHFLYKCVSSRYSYTSQDSVREEEEDEDDEASYKADERIRITEIDYSSFLKGINLDNISKFEPHSLRNPERVKVNQIVQNCSKGIWVLPNFQRYFSWKKNHVKEFLESIFNDYYVGSLLFWDVAKEELQLDIMPIKGSEIKKNELDPSLIILDGQQRITSLYYAIKAPGFHLQGTKSPVYFYINFHSFFNPETKGEIIEILNRKLTDDESFRRMLFPFYQLDEFNKWTYGLEDFMLNTSPENRDKIREVSRLIASKLWHIREGFEIPYISLPESMDVGQITDIFERTNTMGIKLNAFDLLIARLSKYNIELRKIWEEVIKRYPKFENYQKSTEKMPLYILQAISLFYDKNSACKRDDILNIYQRIFEFSNMDFKETWDEMSEYMNKAIHKLENLRDGFGVKDEEQLPFSPTLPILAALIKEVGTRGNKIVCNTMLGVWYWSSVFSNAYSGAVDSQMTSDFKEMRTWFSDDSKIPRTVERARREMISLDLREVRTKGSALFKGVLSILALEGAKDFDTKQVLEYADYNDRDHIFPIAEFASEKDLNSVLNMTWMSGETNRHIKGYKKPSIYIKKFIDEKYGGSESEFLEMLETHMINSAAYHFMKKDDFEGFVEERQKLIVAKIYSLLGLEKIEHGTEIGNSALISPDTPFSNKMIIWDTIKSCQDYIYWIDKYFSTEGLRLLIGSVDEKKIHTIKILTSLARIDLNFRRLFQDFKIEILRKNINCELKILNNKLGSSIHDRWIISKDSSFNIPSPDVIARGQFSEVKSTSNRPPFEKWWDESLDIITNWNDIEKLKNKEQ